MAKVILGYIASQRPAWGIKGHFKKTKTEAVYLNSAGEGIMTLPHAHGLERS